MMPYLLVSIIPLGISFLGEMFSGPGSGCIDEKVRKKRNIFFLIICGIIVFLFMALRSQYVGSTDTRGYCYSMRNAINSSSWKNYYDPDGMEKGFQILIFLLSRVFQEQQWLIVFSSAIFVISAIYFIYHNSDDVVMSIVMYVSLDLMRFQMQGMRQSIAMSICLFAFEFAKKKKPIRFFLMVLLASQMHRTAIVFAVVYFVRWLKLDFKSILILLFGTTLFFSFSDKIVSTANEMFESSYTNQVNSGGFISVVIYSLVILAAFIFDKRLKNDKNEVMLLFLTIIGAICYIFRYFGTLIAERISFYFVFGQLALLPNTINQLLPREKVLVRFFVYILMIALCMYRLLGSDLIPYEFFWQHT